MYKTLIIALLISTALVLGLWDPARSATRTALVIGNADYQSAPP